MHTIRNGNEVVFLYSKHVSAKTICLCPDARLAMIITSWLNGGPSPELTPDEFSSIFMSVHKINGNPIERTT